MGIPQHTVPKHWNYFLTLEADLIALARYVEIDKKNFKTFSLELSRLLVSACGEVDSVLKQICERHSQINRKKWDINVYQTEIQAAYPNFSRASVSIPRYGLSLEPWSNWTRNPPSNPKWWRGHNGIKHNRPEEFEKGNLKNTLNALAGLYIALIYLHEPLGEAELLSPMPNLLHPGQLYGGESFRNGQWSYDYANL